MNYAQVNLAAKEVVHLYNSDRPHFSLNLAALRKYIMLIAPMFLPLPNQMCRIDLLTTNFPCKRISGLDTNY